MQTSLEPVIPREELEAEEGPLPANSLPGLRPARFKAQAQGERVLYQAILKPWVAWTRYVWKTLDLPGKVMGLAADPVSPWTMTARQQAEFDRAVEWFVDALIGHSRDAARFRLPSTANIDVNLPIYEGKPILPGQLRTAYGVGVDRAAQVVGDGAEKLLGIRNEEAQEKMLTEAFDRLSEGARIRLADVLRVENYPGESVQDVLRRCLNEGMNPQSVARELRTKFADIKGYNWPRLARTEVSFAQNRAMVDTYEANGYRLPQVVVDGKTQPQRTPPYHPNCTCGTSIDPDTGWMVPSIAITACELCQAQRIAWEALTRPVVPEPVAPLTKTPKPRKPKPKTSPVTFPETPRGGTLPLKDIKKVWQGVLPHSKAETRNWLAKQHPLAHLLSDKEVDDFARLDIGGAGMPRHDFLLENGMTPNKAIEKRCLELLQEYDARIAAGDPLFSGAEVLDVSSASEIDRAFELVRGFQRKVFDGLDEIIGDQPDGWDWVNAQLFNKWASAAKRAVKQVRTVGKPAVDALLARLGASAEKLTVDEVVETLAVRSTESAAEWRERLMAVWVTDSVKSRSGRENLRIALERLARITSDSMLEALGRRRVEFVRAVGNRASSARIKPHAGNILFAPNDTAETYLHEMLHQVEAELQDAAGSNAEIGGAWRDLVTKQPASLERLSDLTGNKSYRPDEVARRDDWAHPYTGKVYTGGASEVLSMYANLLHAAGDRWHKTQLTDRDIEQIEFVTGLLRGAHKH